MKFMLPSGTVIDTAQPDADEQFHAREPELARGILDLKAHLESDSHLRERVRSKYRTKNTTGYSLNAFLDFDTAVDIFQHVLIGAEGTLAFIAEAVLDTVPDLPVKYTGTAAVSRSLCGGGLHRSTAPGRREGAGSHGSRVAALGREPGGNSGVDSHASRRRCRIAGGVSVGAGSRAQATRRARARCGRRSQAAGSQRRSPTLRPSRRCCGRFAPACFPRWDRCARPEPRSSSRTSRFPSSGWPTRALDLNKLFRKHDYDNAIIFGHAKDGNLHFVITQGFNDQAAVDQYARFIDDVVEVVVNRYDGALKAEHGTGRNMAPFVETEWGSEGYEIMRRLKQLADPHNLLNPGVIINSDPRAHLEDLKRIPTIEPEVDKCIECGYCESKCPSRELTLTPRQRIVVRREMARLQRRARILSGCCTIALSIATSPTPRSTLAQPMDSAPRLVPSASTPDNW